jgi:ADP-ribosyl-[dinitrogen reductase] hydrolase
MIEPSNFFKYTQTSESQIDVSGQVLLKSIKEQSQPNLVDYSAVTPRNMTFISNMLQHSSEHKKRAIGCMMGMVVGDALGAPLEFTPIQYETDEVVTEMINSNHFGLRAGQYTDDTSMGLCIADSLIVKGGFDPADVMLRFIAWWFCGYNNCFRYDDKNVKKHSVGLGGNISKSLEAFTKYGHVYTKSGDATTSGNGSIMRNAPIAVKFHTNVESAMDFAMKQSLTTHHGTDAFECARLLTYICVNLINNKGKQNLAALVASFKSLHGSPNITTLAHSQGDWNWKYDHFKYNKQRALEQPTYIGSYSVDCLAMALHCVNTTSTFEDAVIKAVNMGGDADSVGSVTGQIAGSMYGYDAIPIRWIHSTHYWNGGSIVYRAHLLYEQC